MKSSNICGQVDSVFDGHQCYHVVCIICVYVNIMLSNIVLYEIFS